LFDCPSMSFEYGTRRRFKSSFLRVIFIAGLRPEKYLTGHFITTPKQNCFSWKGDVRFPDQRATGVYARYIFASTFCFASP
jgi:hypothetical protein